MKTNIFIAILLLCLYGCSQKGNPQLTRQETDQIKSEVKAAAEPLMTGWAKLDGSIAIKSFSPEMVSCFDTLLLDYPAYKKSWTAYTEARSRIRLTTIKEDYIILTRDLVIDTWVGKVVEEMKSGDKVTYNPIRYTNIFKKADGKWKIIFAQSSGIPLVEKVEKK